MKLFFIEIHSFMTIRGFTVILIKHVTIVHDLQYKPNLHQTLKIKSIEKSQGVQIITVPFKGMKSISFHEYEWLDVQYFIKASHPKKSKAEQIWAWTTKNQLKTFL